MAKSKGAEHALPVEAGPSTQERATPRVTRRRGKRKLSGNEEENDGGNQGSTSQDAANLPASEQQQKTKKRRIDKSATAIDKFMDKRQATRRKEPSQSALDRLERVLNQRMFLLHRESVECHATVVFTGESATPSAQIPGGEAYKVLGSTQNVYTVVIGDTTTCDCPDAILHASGVCKHVIFVFIKVLGVQPSDHVWFQKALTPAERQRIFADANADPTASNAQLRQAYESAVHFDGSPSKKSVKRRMPDKSDLCAVCYEQFGNTIGEILSFCDSSCGNAIHKKCADQWGKHCRSLGKAYTCVYCNFGRDRHIESRDRRFVARGYMSLNGSTENN